MQVVRHLHRHDDRLVRIGFTEARAYSQATSDKGTAQYMAKKAPILSELLRKALATLG